MTEHIRCLWANYGAIIVAVIALVSASTGARIFRWEALVWIGVVIISQVVIVFQRRTIDYQKSGLPMYENAQVRHVKFRWIGRVVRNSEGRFYDADTIRFWVRWEIGTSATGELPEPGWYPAADIHRVV